MTYKWAPQSLGVNSGFLRELTSLASCIVVSDRRPIIVNISSVKITSAHSSYCDREDVSHQRASAKILSWRREMVLLKRSGGEEELAWAFNQSTSATGASCLKARFVIQVFVITKQVPDLGADWLTRGARKRLFNLSYTWRSIYISMRESHTGTLTCRLFNNFVCSRWRTTSLGGGRLNCYF